MADSSPVRWVAQEGSQRLFLSCPIFECLYEGTRGPGKTDALLMDYAQDVGRGWGPAWRGVLFRQSYPQLADVISKSKQWFPRFFPGSEFNEGKSSWRFPTGEELLLRHMRKPDDYWNYHGHSYPWIGWEELTNWATDTCFKLMMSCSRSTVKGMPRKYRATTNPYGRGHNWIKQRYQLPQMRGRVIREVGPDGEPLPPRVAIHGNIHENRLLLDADPGYIARVRAAARNPSEAEAWLQGSWDITSGGMFDDIWNPRRHVVDAFRVPAGWRIYRSFDWGSSKPFSVGWWAVSDGSPIEWPDGRSMRTLRGDRFRIGEWYGCVEGQENEGLRMLDVEIARGIKNREAAMGIAGRVKPGPADTSIFDEENGICIARNMGNEGVRWERADKSRKLGWQAVRTVLKAALPPEEGGPREDPGLFVVRTCKHFLRTVPSIPRDDADLDDVDTEAEDHVADETRYFVKWKPVELGSGGM